MDWRNKKQRLVELYAKYERLVEPYKSQGVCERGCASCCIDVGSVGGTTLEGLIILEALQGWDKQAIREINHCLQENRKKKMNSVLARCAFLDEEQCCRIYSVRPFSCRRLYSVRKCDGQGAVIHRQAHMAGQQIERKLQQLDPHGCSGHLSFILDLLAQEGFRLGYLQGNWQPKDFGNIIESYELVLHKFTTKE